MPLRPPHSSRTYTLFPFTALFRSSSSPQAKGSKTMAKRVVLAYSGGLDTSVAVRWMIDNLGVEVIALAVDVGQAAEDYDIVKERARAAGAVDAIVVDAKEEYAAAYCMPALAAHAPSENRYPLVSALSRPAVVKHILPAAKFTSAAAGHHGRTSQPN